MLVAAPKMTSPSASAPRLDDASMTYLGRAEAIIRDEVGVDELEKRQENQLTAFKVFFLFMYDLSQQDPDRGR